MRSSLGLAIFLSAAALGYAKAAPAPVADEAAIRAYLTRVYSSYRACPMRPGAMVQPKCVRPPDFRTVFTPSTLAVVQANDRLNDGDMGAASDGDPICGCQDYETIRVTGIQLNPTANGRVIAKVRFNNFGPQTAALVMEKTPSGWRVHDVMTGGTSYRAAVVKENSQLSR